MSAPKKRGLGRGLDALLGGNPSQAGESGEELRELPLSALTPGRHQPRRHFDEDALAQLAQSIAVQGVVQPIVVRPLEAGRYEIIAGERRWRAAKLARLAVIPAVVRPMDDRGAMAVALVENIQRADLNPLEEAEALARLIEECGLTHEQTASAVGRSRTAISNLLRLTELNRDVQQLVRESLLSLGHAKVLLAVDGPLQSELARAVLDRGLSVRQTEALVRAAQHEPRERAARAPLPLETRLSERFGLPVTIKRGAGGRGNITISFRTVGELDRLLERLDGPVG
jgi:ParB family chromosome partitioning protein